MAMPAHLLHAIEIGCRNAERGGRGNRHRRHGIFRHSKCEQGRHGGGRNNDLTHACPP
jgi:hypothetical protein